MGATVKVRDEAPTSRAAIVGLVVTGAVIALVLIGVGLAGRASGSVEWRDATLPTYPAAEWDGEALPVAEALTLDPAVSNRLCPSATAVDGGGTVAVIVADSWRGVWPLTTGFVAEEPVPRLLGGPDGAALEARRGGASEIVVAGRLLDPSRPDDASLTEAWTSLCGDAAAFVQAAPDGLGGGEIGIEG
ncbi:hypothetical protein QQX09_08765 [Demequina sp. SYSU T00192]|uniref:Uncharacterized protein n=1 Tax=Demequina litoralis TaxID=3051660 RepID=A0ABT8GAF0_9MICO|nr:hypothetical protein [Demequina sp. SYSU T00192]MDN4475944.1 hypothetical protein [Demequina sp. SYSU T00192]